MKRITNTILSKGFNRIVKLIGDPVENATMGDITLLGMAASNFLRNKLLTYNTDVQEGRITDQAPAWFTTNMAAVDADELGFNPVLTFPVFGCTRDTTSYTRTGVFVRDVIAHKIADIVKRDSANPPADPQPLNSKDATALKEVKDAVRDRLSHPALEGITLEHFDHLRPRFIHLASELLSVQRRIFCYGFSTQTLGPDYADISAELQKLDKKSKFLSDEEKQRQTMLQDQANKLITLHEKQQARQLIENPDYASPEAFDMVHRTFLPRITRKDENGDMRLLNRADLSKNMRMTLVGYSYGSHFIAQTLNALSQTMADIGYNRDDIDHAFSNLHVHAMQGSNDLAHYHPNSSMSVHDKNDLITLANLTFGGYYPWRLQFASQRLNAQDPNIIINGENSLIQWCDLPQPETAPPQIYIDVKNGTAPASLPYHFSVIEQPEKMPAPAMNALFCSLLETRQIPPVAQAIGFDVEQYNTPRCYGVDKFNYPVFIDEIIQTIQNVPLLGEQVSAYVSDHGEIKLNKAVAELSRAMTETLGDSGIDMSNKAARSAAQLILVRAKDEAMIPPGTDLG